MEKWIAMVNHDKFNPIFLSIKQDLPSFCYVDSNQRSLSTSLICCLGLV